MAKADNNVPLNPFVDQLAAARKRLVHQEQSLVDLQSALGEALRMKLKATEGAVRRQIKRVELVLSDTRSVVAELEKVTGALPL